MVVYDGLFWFMVVYIGYDGWACVAASTALSYPTDDWGVRTEKCFMPVCFLRPSTITNNNKPAFAEASAGGANNNKQQFSGQVKKP